MTSSILTKGADESPVPRRGESGRQPSLSERTEASAHSRRFRLPSFQVLKSRLGNICRVSYLETLFSLRIPASVVFVFLLPSLMLLLLGSRSEAKDFVLPGLFSLVTAFSSMQGVGQVAGSMRRGVWQTFQIAFHPAWLYLAGVLVSRIFRTIIVTTFLLFLAFVAFGYWVEGDILFHFFTIAVGSVTFACFGLFLGYLPKAPNAAPLWINLSTFLLMVVSGIFFQPSGVLETISVASPLTYLTRLIRANAMGTPLGPRDVALYFLILAVWCLVTVGCACYFAWVREDDVG